MDSNGTPPIGNRFQKRLWAWAVRARHWGMSMKTLPALDLTIEPAFLEGSFVFPNPWQHAIGRRPEDGFQVCKLNFGVSPLFDRIYVDGVEVDQTHRREGYGSALLHAVAQVCAPKIPLLPITALYEVSASNGFWGALRASKVKGLAVTRDLRVGEMKAEAARWREVNAAGRHY